MILPIEQQVANLELSKKLKELGFPQDTYFWWYTKMPGLKISHGLLRDKYWGESKGYERIAAPTSAEMGKMFYPIRARISFDQFPTGAWRVGLDINAYCHTKDTCAKTDLTEANSRALMLIYLVEQGLVKFPKDAKWKIR